jgi:exodeoxyribonuclease VII large subunit
MQVMSVSQVTRQVKTLVDGEPLLADLWVAGQVSTFHRASSGHWYFTLIDAESELRCVIWKGLAARVPRMPAQGEMVDAHGYISVYERGGYYQFYADTLEPSGIGALWEQFARLKARLEVEGLFNAERKRPLPLRPRCIGVVTSPTGAALQDILKVLRGRYPLVEVVVSPTLVQGQEAPEGIARAIERLNGRPDVDLIIVARGGGSLEDLWSFNDERVARAIAGTRVPVVTGIGHETDITIADLVADVRAPTPTAAAVAVVPDGIALRAWVHGAPLVLQAGVSGRITRLRGQLAHNQHLLRTLHPMRQVAEKRQRLDDRHERLTATIRHRMSLQRASLDIRVALLKGLDASQVLGRGYAMVRVRSTGERLGSVHQVGLGDGVAIEVRDGRLDARVIETHPRQATGGDSAI